MTLIIEDRITNFKFHKIMHEISKIKILNERTFKINNHYTIHISIDNLFFNP